MKNLQPLVLINAVGLTPKLLKFAPKLQQLALNGWMRPLKESLPAVTATCQATILTGKEPSVHGIVGNGWLFRDTAEVRFWQQSNHLIQAEPIYKTASRLAQAQGSSFKCAKMFWWFNQGADVDISVTPKPYYGADGNKAFGISGSSQELTEGLEKKLGAFPFPSFWGPMAGLPCTRWIAQATAEIIKNETPNLTLAYLPHLDYDPQRFGPTGSDMPKLTRELDQACEPILDAAKAKGARVWIVSEYGHCNVQSAIEPNKILRKHGFLVCRDGPFGETIDFFASRAFAVCDHQLAHIYIKDSKDIPKVKATLEETPGIKIILDEEGKKSMGLAHPRSGELIALSENNKWFAYPYWLDESRAPDFARTVDIHRKPGYDPCELFFDPKLLFPKLKVIRKLLGKKLGFRTLMDVIPLDHSLVKGSHGLVCDNDEDCALLAGDGPAPPLGKMPMTNVHGLMMTALGFTEGV